MPDAPAPQMRIVLLAEAEPVRPGGRSARELLADRDYADCPAFGRRPEGRRVRLHRLRGNDLAGIGRAGMATRRRRVY